MRAKDLIPVPNILAMRRALAFSPHPDDSEVGAGATLARLIEQGTEVHWVVATDGAVGVAFVFGFGYGMYLSTDWALAVDVLPATGHAAKDMGLWAISQTLSQTIANIIGGVLLLILIRRVGLGSAYRALYLVTFLYFVAGSFLVLRVRSTG